MTRNISINQSICINAFWINIYGHLKITTLDFVETSSKTKHVQGEYFIFGAPIC